MNKIFILLTLITSLFVTACSMPPIPKTTKEFRKVMKESTFANFESYEVKRSLKDVTNSIKNNISCFGVMSDNASDYESTIINEGSDYEMTKTPTLNVDKNKAVFYYQLKMSDGLFMPSAEEQPKKGMYVFLVDIFKKSNNSVKVDFYEGTSMGGMMAAEIAAMKAWIKGGSGCLY